MRRASRRVWGYAPRWPRLDVMPFDVAALADQILIDPDEVPHRLGDRWSDQIQVILFLRHFG